MECFICQKEINIRTNSVTIEVLASRMSRHAACSSIQDDNVANSLAALYGMYSRSPLPPQRSDNIQTTKRVMPEELQQRTGSQPLSVDDVLDIREEIKNGAYKKR